MFVVDVNVVVAAHRGDHPHHGTAREWLDHIVSEGDDFGVPAGVWAAFLRLVTHRRIFEVPSPRPEAFAFIDAVVAQPGHLAAEPGPRHLALVQRLCDEAGADGDLVPDAVLGAIAVEHGATVATFDRDFARFTTVSHLRLGP